MRPRVSWVSASQACLYGSADCLLAQRSLKTSTKPVKPCLCLTLTSGLSSRARHLTSAFEPSYASGSSADDLCEATLAQLLPQPHPPAESSSTTQLKRSD